MVPARTPYAYGIKFGFMRDLECPKCAPEARRADRESCEGAGGQWRPWCGWKVFSLVWVEPKAEKWSTVD